MNEKRGKEENKLVYRENTQNSVNAMLPINITYEFFVNSAMKLKKTSYLHKIIFYDLEVTDFESCRIKEGNFSFLAHKVLPRIPSVTELKSKTK